MYSARCSVSHQARMPIAAGFFLFQSRFFEDLKPGVKHGR